MDMDIDLDYIVLSENDEDGYKVVLNIVIAVMGAYDQKDIKEV